MAVDFFLELDEINGESKDAKHTDQITIQSFSWGARQHTSVSGTGGSGAGRATLADLMVTKEYDASSGPIYKALLLGTHIKTGVLSAVKSGGDGSAFLTISLGELFITSIQIGASNETPTESVTFSYNHIETAYMQQMENGQIQAKAPVIYDLKANQVS
ncbi:Hcp family type VI secretion system effector [Granulicella tundricola]|uniref:Type VI secretion system effector, Hcp1 family n=1 Tax=Granulicella tundricola (strain ATCC BAA-1859 / DSM 23138 / MP5ACTX9) TaxID=1198114 RepID=E8WWQ5_GRATM|nr:type VI secretion system tube protein Hcp [Granulicella tundricola]ADW67383.1 protein of unknown function DUF796 [Granulicella tundricola MP5ACTX9]